MSRAVTVFVSFRSLDLELVRHVFARLTAQGLRPWNYAMAGESIPVSERIPEWLEAQVNKLDCFIPILTPESMAESSEFTRMEADFAVRRWRRESTFRILPLVSDRAPHPGEWPAPFRDISRLRHSVLDTGVPPRIETAVLELVQALGIPYVPPPADAARLPFMAAFYREIAGVMGRRATENSVYVTLMQLAADFMTAFASSDYSRARLVIDYFINICEYHYPQHTFYYPYVARLAVTLALNDLDNVERFAVALIDRGGQTDDPWVARAVAAARRAEYRIACGHYEQALALKQDPASVAGLLVCQLLAGQEVDVDQALRALDQMPRAPSDTEPLAALRAFALSQRGRLGEAHHIYRELSVKGPLTDRQTENYAQVLDGLGRSEEALHLLRSAVAKSPHARSLRQAMIVQLVRLGRRQEAISELEDLARRDGLDRNLLGFSAQLLYALGACESARRVAARTLEWERLGLPRTAGDFYHCGAANWILGRSVQAEYDFERSGEAHDKHYQSFLGEPA